MRAQGRAIAIVLALGAFSAAPAAWAAEMRSVPGHAPKAVKQDLYGKDGVARWLPKAKKGDVFAQYVLGHMYCEGKHVKQDYAEGIKWYERAANQGFAPGQLALGSMYFAGQGVDKDYNEAARWFRKAAEKGYDRAQNNLASLYFEGRGVKKDYHAAFRWYRAAAVQGFKSAQYSLGVMFLRGLGMTKPDRVTGFALLRHLQERGEHRGDTVLKSVAGSLSKDQLQAGQKLAKRMQSKSELKVILEARAAN